MIIATFFLYNHKINIFLNLIIFSFSYIYNILLFHSSENPLSVNIRFPIDMTPKIELNIQEYNFSGSSPNLFLDKSRVLISHCDIHPMKE